MICAVVFFLQWQEAQSNVDLKVGTARAEAMEEQKTAVIHGLAGTGKTVLAIEKAKSLAAKDEQVLFLCYNSFLKENLKGNNTIPNVTFHNAHSLAYEIMGGSNVDMDRVLEEFEEFLTDVFDKRASEGAVENFFFICNKNFHAFLFQTVNHTRTKVYHLFVYVL